MTTVFRQGKRKRLLTGLFLASFLLMLFAVVFSQFANAQTRVLKVGYVDTGSIQYDEDGNPSGYVADYLDALSEYTGWEYEFVYGTLAECVAMLKSGEMDLLGLVRHTEEREDIFLYSELPMADDYTVLCCAPDRDFYYQDYEAFDGCKVGLVANTIYEDSFVEHAEVLGLDYELVYFSVESDAKLALLKGEIDLFATGGLSNQGYLKLVDRFALERAYFVTGLGNQELMDELNMAIQTLRLENPALPYELAEKHYVTNNYVTNLYLTREEQAYLNSADPILVKGFDGWQPMVYAAEDGALVGILTDYLTALGEASGLKFVYEAAETGAVEETVSSMLEEGHTMLYSNQDLDTLAPKGTLLKTVPLIASSMTYIKSIDAPDITGSRDLVFALSKEMSYLETPLLSRNDHYTIRSYENAEACMEAVLQGEVDMTILDEYVAGYLLQKPQFADNLKEVHGDPRTTELCLYATAEDEYLISILNKTLEHMDETKRSNIVSTALLGHPYEYKLADLFYAYGSWIWLSAGLLAIILVLCMLLYIRITKAREQKRENEALQERVQLDELTGVYNRTAFFEKSQAIIDQTTDDMYIVRLNVCHFKLINELYGVEKGDLLLKEIGDDLKKRSQDLGFIVGRFTGDHFYLCIPKSVFHSIAFPQRSHSTKMDVEITMTYGVYPVSREGNLPVSAMCDRADMANASNEQTTVEHIAFYSDKARQQLLRDQEIEREMEQALTQRQFCIYIQPKYDTETETIVGGEALVRWLHPRKGLIPPGEFIGLFERNGFIMKLDHFIWEECCRFLAASKENGLPLLPLSMNVSRLHFYSSDLTAVLTGLIEKYGLDAENLELEITESVCSDDPDMIFSKCEELRSIGFKIAMDDFGSGYSSLNMLKEMPLDIIKMDLRFLSRASDAAQAEKGQHILGTLIQLSHTLNLKVVVEGLETEEQKRFIQKLGRCSAQGYYYSKPVDCGTYEQMLVSG